MNDNFLWTEKYRPRKISECILTPNTKKIFEGILRDGDIPNLLLCGNSGIGKTTVAKALCREMDMDYMFINASIERGIDVLRTDIKRYASSVSLLSDSNKRKIVIMDEADQLTNDAQPAFRAFMEEYSSNCGFIFTCNFPSKIIDAIHSRCSVIDFKIADSEKKDILIEMVKRVSSILDKENIEHDKKVLVALVKNYFPDFRRTLNEIYRYSRINNKIDEGILALQSNLDISALVESMKKMNYDDVRKWVVENLDNDPSKIYHKLYKNFKDHMDNNNLAKAVILLSDYQFKSSSAADQELNLLACVTELMIECELK